MNDTTHSAQRTGAANTLSPEEATALLNQAFQHHGAGQLSEAEQLYRKLLLTHPDHFDCLHLLGVLHYQRHQYDSAIAQFDLALGIDPDAPAVHHNRGAALSELWRFDEAAAAYSKAIAIKPDYTEAFYKRGRALNEMRRYQEAVHDYDHALALKPNDADALYSRGNALVSLNRLDEAFASFNKAVELKPNLYRAYSLLAWLHDSRGQIAQALEMWQHAEPLNDATTSGLACQAILKLPSATYQDIAALQRKWAERFARPITGKEHVSFRAYDGRRRIRIGYHCSFMDSDTVRYIMLNAIAAHDRSRFEVFGYATKAVLSDDTRSAFDEVRCTATLNDSDFIDLVRKDGIDVLVELTGFSNGHRYVAMASRCAPVQVSHLNHHGTTCIPAVDYFLSDELSTPTGSDADPTFTERIFRLPVCLLRYDYTRHKHPPVCDPPSLAGRNVTFGCFGSGAKINAELIGLWAELLQRVPASILYLRNTQLSAPDHRRYIAEQFVSQGIPSERLRIEGGTDRNSLLESYADVDVSLDTWPYGGGNTVAESLWQGVPVVSLKGSRISSRYASSLLTAAGCAEHIAESREEYVAIAAKLAADPGRLKELRHSLRRMCTEHGLNDSTRYARDLENAYEAMLKQSSVAQTLAG